MNINTIEINSFCANPFLGGRWLVFHVFKICVTYTMIRFHIMNDGYCIHIRTHTHTHIVYQYSPSIIHPLLCLCPLYYYEQTYYIFNWLLLVFRLTSIANETNSHRNSHSLAHMYIVHAHGISTQIHIKHIRSSTYIIGFTIVSFLLHLISRSFIYAFTQMLCRSHFFSHSIVYWRISSPNMCVCVRKF